MILFHELNQREEDEICDTDTLTSGINRKNLSRRAKRKTNEEITATDLTFYRPLADTVIGRTLPNHKHSGQVQYLGVGASGHGIPASSGSQLRRHPALEHGTFMDSLIPYVEMI